jgi:hypothetical protein
MGRTDFPYRMAKYRVLALRKCTVEVRVVKQWFSAFHSCAANYV